MQKTLDDLRRSVLDAFAAVPKPPQDAIAPHPCCECAELAADLFPHAAHAVPPSVLSTHVWDLPLLSDEGKQYYLAAWLLRALDDDLGDAADAVILALDADHRWQPATPYTPDQWLAIDRWLACIGERDEGLREDARRVRGKLPK